MKYAKLYDVYEPEFVYNEEKLSLFGILVYFAMFDDVCSIFQFNQNCSQMKIDYVTELISTFE